MRAVADGQLTASSQGVTDTEGVGLGPAPSACQEVQRSPSTKTSTRRNTLFCQPGLSWV